MVKHNLLGSKLNCLAWKLFEAKFTPFTLPQLTVVPQLPPRMDLWRATPAQQRAQRCSTVVTHDMFQWGGWELFALIMGGVQILLSWTALWVCGNPNPVIGCFGEGMCMVYITDMKCSAALCFAFSYCTYSSWCYLWTSHKKKENKKKRQQCRMLNQCY